MILDRFRLDGKIALITNAVRSLGHAMALALAESGADVAIAGKNKEGLELSAQKIRQQTGRNVLPVVADSSRLSDIEMLVSTTLREFGRIDILVNNAGIALQKEAGAYSEQEWDEVINASLKGLFFLAQKVGKAMIQRGGGKIINIFSALSEIGAPHMPAYAASRRGLRQLTKSFALEWARYNINVNGIGLGYFRTEQARSPEEDRERNEIIMNCIALKRWGEPEDLMGVIVFLASPASDYLTGQVIHVDGGVLTG